MHKDLGQRYILYMVLIKTCFTLWMKKKTPNDSLKIQHKTTWRKIIWLKYQTPDAISECHHLFPSVKFKVRFMSQAKVEPISQDDAEVFRGHYCSTKGEVSGTQRVGWSICCLLVHNHHHINWVGRSWGDITPFWHSLEFCFSQKLEGVTTKSFPHAKIPNCWRVVPRNLNKMGYLIHLCSPPLFRRMQIRIWRDLWIQRQLLRYKFPVLVKTEPPFELSRALKSNYVCGCMRT